MAITNRIHNRVRVRSDENVVTNALVELRHPDTDEWIDVRRAVTGIGVELKVGEASRVRLDLLLADVEIGAAIAWAPAELLEATAEVMRACGYICGKLADDSPTAGIEPIETSPLLDATTLGARFRRWWPRRA